MHITKQFLILQYGFDCIVAALILCLPAESEVQNEVGISLEEVWLCPDLVGLVHHGWEIIKHIFKQKFKQLVFKDNE